MTALALMVSSVGQVGAEPQALNFSLATWLLSHITIIWSVSSILHNIMKLIVSSL